MSHTSLWRIPEKAETTRTPTTALKEQAVFLSRQTNRILRADVTRYAMTRSGEVKVSLFVVAPSLNDYAVEVLEVRHGLFDTYPSHVESSINDIEEEVFSEEALLGVVETILHSEEMAKILRSLLSESQSGNA